MGSTGLDETSTDTSGSSRFQVLVQELPAQMPYPPDAFERYKRQRATELLRYMLEHDSSLREVLNARMLEGRQDDWVLAPQALKALWRMDRWNRPVQAVDQSEWIPF